MSAGMPASPRRRLPNSNGFIAFGIFTSHRSSHLGQSAITHIPGVN